MARCPAAKIVVGLAVSDWVNIDLSKYIADWKASSTGWSPEEPVWQMYELHEVNLGLAILNPPEYDGFEDDVVIGVEVLEVYSQPAELDIPELLVKIDEAKAKFKEFFGFDGKVYWAGDYY